jgi:hypothetical protein
MSLGKRSHPGWYSADGRFDIATSWAVAIWIVVFLVASLFPFLIE